MLHDAVFLKVIYFNVNLHYIGGLRPWVRATHHLLFVVSTPILRSVCHRRG